MKKLLLIMSLIVTSLWSAELKAQIIFYVTDPTPLVGTYDFTYASNGWGMSLDTIFIQEQLVLVDDGSAADSLGCGTLVNGAQLAGKIAVVYRGTCQFGAKAKNAQNAGAIGIIIINNVGGAPVGMAPGDSGANVTIPVVMVSQATGALLRPAIDAGTANAMIGNKTGVFANDVGAYRPHVVIPNSWAIPSPIAQNASQFEIPVGAWVFNFGQNNQTNVTLTATISYGGSVIYNQTSGILSIIPGDTVYVSLPLFSQAGYPDGFYRLDYTINTPVDDFPDDNIVSTHFWIQPDHYSKSRWDTLTMQPIRTSHYRADTVTLGNDFQWCIVLDHPDAGNLTAHAVSFSATASSGDLTNNYVEINLFQWNDVITNTLTFNNLFLLDQVYHDYIDNSDAGLFVTEYFNNPIPLSSNEKYLVCIHSFGGLFFGADDNVDYQTSWEQYNDLGMFFPIRTGTDPTYTWGGGGFGSSPVPAIILHTSALGLDIEDQSAANGVMLPYPNPSTDFITIPMNFNYNGEIIIDVYDLAGKKVHAERVKMNKTNMLRVQMNNVSNGLYYFNLKFADDSSKSFPVMISR